VGDLIQAEHDSPRTENEIIGQSFPEITSKSLVGRVVTLPDALKGKIVLVCIAFIRSVQSMIGSWVHPFGREFGKDSMFTVYEVPMIISNDMPLDLEEISG